MPPVVSFRETSSRSRIGRMAHSLIDTGITGGIIIFGKAKAVGRFKTSDHHRPMGYCGPLMLILLCLYVKEYSVRSTWTGERFWSANLAVLY